MTTSKRSEAQNNKDLTNRQMDKVNIANAQWSNKRQEEKKESEGHIKNDMKNISLSFVA